MIYIYIYSFFNIYKGRTLGISDRAYVYVDVSQITIIINDNNNYYDNIKQVDNTIKQVQMKEKFKNEYLRRMRISCENPSANTSVKILQRS